MITHEVLKRTISTSSRRTGPTKIIGKDLCPTRPHLHGIREPASSGSGAIGNDLVGRLEDEGFPVRWSSGEAPVRRAFDGTDADDDCSRHRAQGLREWPVNLTPSGTRSSECRGDH